MYMYIKRHRLNVAKWTGVEQNNEPQNKNENMNFNENAIDFWFRHHKLEEKQWQKVMPTKFSCIHIEKLSASPDSIVAVY